MTTTTDKIDRLRLAQDLLRERGWCRFQMRDVAGQICMLEALRVAGMQAEMLWDVIEDMPMPSYPVMSTIERICRFNNHEAKTMDGVIAQLQITIDRLASTVRERELVAV